MNEEDINPLEARLPTPDLSPHGRLHMETQQTYETDPECVSRRSFFSKLCIALSGVCAVILGVPVVGFVIAPLFRKMPRQWVTVGKIGDFEIGKTVSVPFNDPSPLPWAGITAKNAAWLRRNSATEFIAFSVNCTHLGCPVRWLPDAELFMCPCHGGVYYKDGTVAAGPPPRPLNRYAVRVVNDQVQLQPTAIPITTVL
ncbi:MAG: Rieske 2Fe-2S domain-containing protein [Chthoniobacteraceae bacterium]|jgi:menaquinol-cytochrome c reductase iron-sulfur subunit